QHGATCPRRTGREWGGVLRSRGRRGAVLAVSGAVISAVLTSCGGGSGPTGTIDSYLRAWDRADYTAMARLVQHPPSNFVASNRRIAADLDLVRASHSLRSVSTSGSDAT